MVGVEVFEQGINPQQERLQWNVFKDEPPPPPQDLTTPSRGQTCPPKSNNTFLRKSSKFMQDQFVGQFLADKTRPWVAEPPPPPVPYFYASLPAA